MKKLNITLLGLLMLFIAASDLLAQTPTNSPSSFEHKTNRLIEELDLSKEQANKVRAIHEKYVLQLAELRQTHREARIQSFEEKMELRQARKVALEEVLTEEQMRQLEEKMAHRRQHFHSKKEGHRKFHQEGRGTRRAAQKEVKAYLQENVFPTLQSQRSKLNRYISAEDKATIEDLRRKKAEMKSQKRELRQSMREAFRNRDSELGREKFSEMTRLREVFHTDRLQARTLAEKYGDKMKELKGEIETDIQQWRSDIRGLVQQNMDEEGGEHFRRFREKHLSFLDHRVFSKVGFLLLDSN